ncbi:SH3 domain-containing protein C23A1.17-like, partial [Osmia bicornis bicornis]|uniref:SH3 domain-containing protein C23A1.17-like n=1 Tax=Osmia bicornis bicornis TaxID=1437191 RepID=UPI001EAF5D53
LINNLFLFQIFLLVVSAIAVNAHTVSKKVEKRGLLTGHHGYSSGGVASGVVYGGHGVGSPGGYLPPVPSVAVIKKPYPVVPAPTYAVPSYAAAVPAPTYGVPSLTVGPSYATSVVHQVPSVGVHGHVPVYNGHVPAPAPAPAPAPSYGTPSYASAPVYAVPSVHQPVSVGSVSLGAGSLSHSYGVPSTSFEAVPAAGVSLGTVSYPSKTYGVPSNVAVGTGLSLSHLSVPTKSYGVAAVLPVGGYSDLSVGSAHLPSPSYGVPSHGVHGGHDDGYSYPVPSNKLLV